MSYAVKAVAEDKAIVRATDRVSAPLDGVIVFLHTKDSSSVI